MEPTQSNTIILHVHPYSAVTQDGQDHRHALSGYTAPAPNTPEHVHHFAGVSTYNQQHAHRFGDTTGPAILQSSRHTHPSTGYTSCDLGHSHLFQGETESDVEC
ncbi:MAG TPA: YmaF family protein [Bacillota bacterium]|nr:YmaF family protein [Bacillota bacterium]